MSSDVALPTSDIKKTEKTEFTGEIPVFKVSGVFSSHMVLQRNKPIRVWGFADKDGVAVTGEFCGETVCTAVKNNRFELVFSPREASEEPLTMSIYDDRGNKTIFEDILVGDVWLIGGQSNAELNLMPCLSVTPVEEFDENANFRLFMQTQYYPFTHQEFCGCPQPDIINPEWRWKRPDRDASVTFSALGWFFAEKLSKDQNVPIGMLNMSAGGACISELASEELAEKLGYDHGANVRQGGYYNTLINPVVGLQFSGMIFFQGESEGIWKERAEIYDKELAALVEDERQRFGYDFPFFYVQLSDYREECKTYFPHLDIVRVRQFDALKLIKDSYMTVDMDLGSPEGYPDFAHSPYKKALADRMCALVNAAYYGTGSVKDANSPMPSSAKIRDGKIEIKFDNVSGGLQSKSGGRSVEGFSFGEYGSLIPAKAEITAPDTVTVFAPGNTELKRVNYAFSIVINSANAQLIKSNGLPCPAFSIGIE